VVPDVTAWSLAELVLVAACGWPLLRLALNRHLLRAAPRLHALLAIALVAAAVVVGVAAAQAGGPEGPSLRAALLLHAVTVAAVALAAAAAGRARGWPERPSSLPPGSLSLTASIEAIVDRGFYARHFERLGPVFKMAQFNEKVVCVLGHDRWHDLVRSHGRHLGPSLQRINEDVRGGFLRYMDEDRHRVYGRLFRMALADTVVSAADPVARRAARQQWSSAAAACEAGGPVRPDEYLRAIVLAAFARALFGIDPERDAGDLDTLGRLHAALEPVGLGQRLSGAGRAAFGDLDALIRRRAAAGARSSALAGDTTCALSELSRLDAAMPDDTCVDNLILILKIGTANVLGLLRWLVATLGNHPEWLDRLRADLGAGGDTSPGPRLADRIVMETLRLEQSEYLYRRVVTGFRHGGFDFPAGWHVRLCVRESHRRADVFASPDSFDPDRFLGRTPSKLEYSPFGTGSHACNGVDLTYVVCRAVLEELARGFELRLAGDGPPERDFRHWSHWRPSASLRIRITPLAVDR
jgi:cytochrome P450